MISPGTANPDLHFAAAYKASEVACEIIDVLPGTDIVDELSHLIEIQYQLMQCIIERKHFGDDNIKTFINYADEIKWQARRLKEDK